MSVQGQIEILGNAIMELQTLMQTVMFNQNNINKRLEALESRQDPATHNTVSLAMSNSDGICPQCSYEFCECEEERDA